MHYGVITRKNKASQNIFGLNSSKKFGMAYGFSLDENPNLNQSWKADDNVPSKPLNNIGSGQDVTLTIGPWIRT